MKNKIVYILFILGMLSCKAQIYSLRPAEINLPENSYQKDIDNELPAYEGIWKGTWDNKTIFVVFKKITNKYNENLKYYKDYLIGKFKIINDNGSVLFDNTNLPDDKTKIIGASFRRYGDKYLLSYADPDLCFTSGSIRINFTNATKTQLNWNLYLGSNMITDDCPYYNTGIPQPLPEEIVLTKQ